METALKRPGRTPAVSMREQKPVTQELKPSSTASTSPGSVSRL